MQEDGLSETLFRPGMGTSLQQLQSTLKHVSFAKRLSQRLNIVRHFVHPHIKESLSLLHDLGLQDFLHCLDFAMFSEEDKVFQCFEVCNAIECGNLTDWALSQFW